MLNADRIGKSQTTIDHSVLESICQLLGHHPSRTINIYADVHNVIVEFLTPDGRRVTETLEVVRGK